MKRLFVYGLLALAVVVAGTLSMEAKLEPGTYAHFTTPLGKFTVKLADQDAPKTVANFVGLAEGTKEWTDPKSGEKVKKPYYDGLIFHRVIDGLHDPGRRPARRRHRRPGLHASRTSSARSSATRRKASCRWPTPGRTPTAASSSSPSAPTPHLDNKHSVFGEVVEGMDVVRKIGKVQTGADDKPVTPVTMSIKIERVK